jgi:catechol 2,3-dioxygenase-like lactoylglutathione lyase family enzyme
MGANPGGRTIHIALGVEDVERSVPDYSSRLGCPPVAHVAGEYALWRSREVNFSIRRVAGPVGLRHLGWEDDNAAIFSSDVDVNGIVWERFSAAAQDEEIRRHWRADRAAKVGGGLTAP